MAGDAGVVAVPKVTVPGSQRIRAEPRDLSQMREDLTSDLDSKSLTMATLVLQSLEEDPPKPGNRTRTGPDPHIGRADLQFVGLWAHGEPKDGTEVWFSSPRWPDEPEPPQQSHKHQEELHAGQPLAQTRPGSWPRETGREWHEGLWLHKLSLVVEEVLRVEVVGELPLALLPQHRRHVGGHDGSLGNNINTL